MLTDTDIAWLAGLLEGEGCFLGAPPSSPNQPLITVVMTDLDVIQRVADMFGCSVVTIHTDRQNPRWKPTYKARMGGSKAVSMMHLLRPMMGARRQAQIDKAIASVL